MGSVKKINQCIYIFTKYEYIYYIRIYLLHRFLLSFRSPTLNLFLLLINPLSPILILPPSLPPSLNPMQINPWYAWPSLFLGRVFNISVKSFCNLNSTQVQGKIVFSSKIQGNSMEIV